MNTVPRLFDFPFNFLKRRKKISRLGELQVGVIRVSTFPAGGQCPASRDQYPETAETSQAFFGGRFRRRFRKLGENKIFHRTVVKQILDGVCFVLHVFCCSKNDIEVKLYCDDYSVFYRWVN